MALTRGARGVAAFVSWTAVISGIVALALALALMLALRKRLDRASREGRPVAAGVDGSPKPHPSGGGVAEASYRGWVERRATRRGVALDAQIRNERSQRMVLDVNVPLIAAFTCSLCVASVVFAWGSWPVTVMLLMYALLWILMGFEIHTKATIRMEVLEHLRRNSGSVPSSDAEGPAE